MVAEGKAEDTELRRPRSKSVMMTFLESHAVESHARESGHHLKHRLGCSCVHFSPLTSLLPFRPRGHLPVT